jgi:chromosome segregation ATPase
MKGYNKPLKLKPVEVEQLQRDLQSRDSRIKELEETAKLIEDRLFEQGKIMREKNDKISSLESEIKRLETELDKFYKGNY